MLKLLVPDFAFPQGTAPGEYRFTPGTPLAFGPRLGEAQPFVLNDGSQFRPGPPHAVTDKRYTADFNEVKRLGGDGVTTPSARTADQTQIALFWVESSPLQWNRIARTASLHAGLDLWENARLFALLNMALTDGYIGTFETKYHYNYWRPVTAIQMAATDGNPQTVADPTWTPLHDRRLRFPTMTRDTPSKVGRAPRSWSASSVPITSASAPAARRCPREASAASKATVVRRYSSFSQAAAENGLSRILVGYHFREAVDVGIDHGSKIGRWTVDRSLRPARTGTTIGEASTTATTATANSLAKARS